MKDLLNKGLALGLGFAIMSKEQVEKFVDEMVNKGQISSTESKDYVNELIQKGEDQQKELQSKVRDQIQKVLSDLDIPSKADIERLEKRIQELEAMQKTSAATTEVNGINVGN